MVKLLNNMGHDGLSYGKRVGHLLHAAVNDIIRNALLTAGLPAVLEYVVITRGEGKRPDGMAI